MLKNKASNLVDFSLLFDFAWATYKKNFINLFKINFIPVILVAYLVSMFPFISDFQSIVEYIQVEDFLGLTALVLGLLVMIIVISSLNYIAQIKTLITADGGTEIETPVFSFSYKYAATILLSYIWVLVLCFFAIVSGILLLVVPGVIVAVWFSFSTFILIEGKAQGSSALKLSKKYVEGIWFTVVLRLLGVVLLSMLGGTAFNMFLDVTNSMFLENRALETLLNAMYQLFVVPYFVVYGYELYKDVVKVNE